ncbi:DUF4178 domain-containing protein [Flavobacterium circumlabens]|uniref:DUF4178 domain-containing protein n=1 Tax=Flavobacterium circumlabens TaxID=2133765 RepID=A0A4Y7UHW1_9FLAO|nr:DUF4178 domain-containing protein [Flavobacterium circumlabens]TCN60921.1 uncharacterized protein DUF4178 [Flavobacterium circumlabens]TEB46040.1 DUF4178 domain-containing protein [Flavobacterium circumlabens]
MKVPCYDCNTVTELEVGFKVVSFVCPKCHSLYLTHEDGELRRRSKFKSDVDNFAFTIGNKGFLKGEEYTVTGMIVKKVYPDYFWKEYILVNKRNEFVYLSEVNGHWIFLKEIEEEYDVREHPQALDYNEQEFKLYEYSDVAIETAAGFFDFEVPNTWIHMVEYIQPPLMISIEKMNKVQTTYLGEYISKGEIKKAFPNSILRLKTGVSVVQPFYFDVTNTAIVFCFFALLIICSNWYIYKDQTEQNVFYKEIAFDSNNTKEIISAPFELKGGSAPLSIWVSTEVDNSWANVDVALVDEKTSEEIHANKDIEYYSGYEDGESWTEGGQTQEFNICGIKEGKYHLLITSQKAPEDTRNNVMKVKVVWNQPSSRNVWLVIIFMIVILVVIRFARLSYEKRRWEDSHYSPYSE